MTRGPDKQFDRDEALHKAMQLFWNQGYEATGVADLLSHMGVGRQSLYDTFGSKRELFLESLRAYFAERKQEMAGLLSGSGTALEKLRAVYENGERLQAEAGPWGCMLGNSVVELGPHDPEVAAMLRSFFAEIKQVLAAILAAGQEAGEVRGDLDADDMASTLLVTLQGGALFAKIECEMETSRAAFRGAIECLKPS